MMQESTQYLASIMAMKVDTSLVKPNCVKFDIKVNYVSSFCHFF